MWFLLSFFLFAVGTGTFSVWHYKHYKTIEPAIAFVALVTSFMTIVCLIFNV